MSSVRLLRIVPRVNLREPTIPTLARLRQARAQQETVRRSLRRLIPIFVALIVLSVFRAHPGPGLAGRSLVVSISLAGFAAGLLAAGRTIRSPGGWNVALAFVLLASSAALMSVQPAGPGAVGVFVGVVLGARRLPERTGIVLSASVLVILAAITALNGRGPGVALLALLGGFFGMVALSDRLGEANEQAEQLLLALEQSRAAEARAAGLAERQRLAREMHDVLAHSLSGLILQLEGARMLAVESPNDPRLPQAIDLAHHLGKSGLDEARRAIGMLRDEELPGPERLAELAERFQEGTGTHCSLTISGEQALLGSEARLALYRVAQEALTNIGKHANPARVEMRLVYDQSFVRLTVEDFTKSNGASPPVGDDTQAGSGGYGLTGMRERARLLGGTLHAEATSTGFRVHLDVPK